MLTKILTSTLVLILVASTWLLAGQAYAAERAMWVWGIAKDIVMDTAGTGAKKDFFDFCASPHGDTAKVITRVFFDAKPWGVNLMSGTNAAKLRQFLAEAHAKTPRINVEFLSGDKSWSTPEYRSNGETLIDEVTDFNLGSSNTNERFDGIQYDVEPYLLRTKEESDPYDWEYDKGLVWNEYLTLLTNCKAKINTYNSANNPDIRFGVAIPYWYSAGSTYGPEAIIDRVDYVAIMDYKDTAVNLINGAQEEVNYAASASKKVYVGVEATHPTDTVGFPVGSTFYEEGNSAMETELAQVHNAFLSSTGYAGIAIHYYEDLTGPMGKEISYRSLWTTSNPYKGHFPIVSVISPNRAGEIWYKGVSAGYIQWQASDLDGSISTIKIEYSTNGGTSWTTIAASTPNTGNYPWNTNGLVAGSNYLIRVTATDNSANVGYDVSNNTFSISSTVTPTNITDLHLWNESASSLRLKWTPPNYTPRSYRIYCSVNGAVFPGAPTYDNVVAVDKYIDTGLSGTAKYKYQIKAVYGNGAEGSPSNASNMLIPGQEFLVDYCEGNEGVTYRIYGTSTLNQAFTNDRVEGLQSMSLYYSYPGSGWGALLIGDFPVKVDISPYNAVRFSGKFSLPVDPIGFGFQLREKNRPEGNEIWQSSPIKVSGTWAEFKVNFSDFTRVDIIDDSGNPLPPTAGNFRIDIHSIGGYGVVFTSQTQSNVFYYFDAVRFIKEGATISVPQSAYDFGTVTGSISNHRFKIGPIPVTFGGFASPWTVRMWTNNGAGPNQAGLKGADGITYIPLKVWCINYGPTTNVPDEENDYFYNGYDFGDGTNIGRQFANGSKEDVYTSGTFDENYWGFDIDGDGYLTTFNAAGFNVYEGGFWYRIPEDDEMVPSNRYTWRRLCWAPGGELSSPVNIYLAIDVAGKKNQQYQTTTLTVEYINE